MVGKVIVKDLRVRQRVVVLVAMVVVMDKLDKLVLLVLHEIIVVYHTVVVLGEQVVQQVKLLI
jgi:hypothetical protein